MPKSNFNQFLDECEHFKKSENKTMNKISFETNHHDHHHDREYQENENQSQSQSQSVTENPTYKTSLSSEKISNAFSSNIFLSKNPNNPNNTYNAKRQSQNRFENTGNPRKDNVFKKMDANKDTSQRVFQNFGATSSSSSSSNIVEINNETFPSLVPTSVSSTTITNTNKTVPKKFKNFKDAICASSAEPALSPTKQKQLKAMAVKQSSVAHHHPTPLAVKNVKKDSELYAKKILAKTKNLAYDDGDYHTDDNNEESLYKSNYKQIFIKRRCNDDVDDSDD